MFSKLSAVASGLFAVSGMVLSFVQGGRPPGIPPGTTAYALHVPSTLPPPPLPRDNQLTVEGVNLGQRLFQEKKLSGNNTMACSSCHHEVLAFSDAPNQFSTGIDGVKGTRNAPALFNLAYQNRYFWDGRAPSLRVQALQPIQNPVELHDTLPDVLKKLSADQTYVKQFAKAFGSAGITPERIGLAMEQYMLTIYSGDSKFDRFRAGKATLTAQEQHGLKLFQTPFDPKQGKFGADCARCHSGPLFSDLEFKNNGVDIDPNDIGLMLVTNRPQDKDKFKTPSLRNVEVTAPFMHAGEYKTLSDAVGHYMDDITPSATLDPGLARLNGGLHLSA